MKIPLVANGVSTCTGCGMEIVLRNILDVLGPDTMIVIPPGCAALFSGDGDVTALRIPGFQGNLENTAAYAAGIRAGLDRQNRREVHVLAFAGDGATADIGLQSLSGVFERQERIIYVCYDNEAYMNTGMQRSSSSPQGAWTSTTPGGKPAMKKDMLSIARAHGIPYIASASAGYIPDLKRKISKAKKVMGPSYIHIHTPCPTGWGFESRLTVEVARKAVESGMWELYEIENGEKTVSRGVIKHASTEAYFSLQKRFSKVSSEFTEERVQDEDKD